MSISVHLHKVFQPYCNDQKIVHVKGSTVNECLDYLISQYPDVEKAIYTGNNKLHPLVEIYLNSTSTYPDALNKKVADGDKLHIIHTLAGG